MAVNPLQDEQTLDLNYLDYDPLIHEDAQVWTPLQPEDMVPMTPSSFNREDILECTPLRSPTLRISLSPEPTTSTSPPTPLTPLTTLLSPSICSVPESPMLPSGRLTELIASPSYGITPGMFQHLEQVQESRQDKSETLSSQLRHIAEIQDLQQRLFKRLIAGLSPDARQSICPQGSTTPTSMFALTFRPSEIPIKEIAKTLKRHPNVRAYLIGDLENRGKVDSEPHYHCYLRFRLRQKPYLVRSMFPTKIAWLKAIEPNFTTTHTHVEAVNAYLKYCTKERPALFKEGDFLHSYKDRSKSAQVLDLVKQGYRRTQLETQFPAMVSTIAKLMTHRPFRDFETQCLYVWGPPGTGKSTTIHKVFQALKKIDWRADYYTKMGASTFFCLTEHAALLGPHD